MIGERSKEEDQGRLQIWDLEAEQRPVVSLDTRDPILAVAYAPGGDAVAAGTSRGEIILIEPASGDRIGIANSHDGGVGALTYAPDRALLASVLSTTAASWSRSTLRCRHGPPSSLIRITW
jgi:WD40 repeat protein